MNTTWDHFGEKLMTRAKKDRIPLIGQFELTPRCNLQCKMCYICTPVNDKDSLIREHPAKEWVMLAEEARDAGMLYLLLTGGEVFVRQDIKEIYKEISMMGLCTEIYTNATLITPELAKWLGKRPPSKIGVTLYGFSPETYYNVCGCAEAFESALKGIELILDEGISVELRTTVVRGNVQDYDKIYEYARQRDLELGIVNYITPRREGNITYPEAVRLTPQELAAYESYVKGCLGQINTVIDDDNDALEESNADQSTINDAFKCTAGKCSFWISWDGKMTPCGFMSSLATYPFKNKFLHEWTHMQQLCSSIKESSQCLKCSLKPFCMSCPAMLESETGMYNKPSEYFCQMAQIRKGGK